MKPDPKIVILANGLFPTAQRGLDLLKAADLLICCDGAADKLIAKGMSPHVIIGDMDSLSTEVSELYASLMIQSDDQESNDLTKAVHYCIEEGYPSVTILGATGLREDHTLGNISLMMEYYPRIEVQIISDFGVFFLAQSGEQVPTFVGEKISFFSIDNRVRVSSTGLKYPLNDLQLSNWYRASLNEATANHFILNFESDLPLIVYRAWGQG
ncbi:MAG: thiamine diphosphokinase [Bacteroidales bacterium]|nr:thiamine diphosphokinase [Bacteroidales bacterium]